MKSITSILTALALGTTLAVAADEKPATPATKTEATKGAEKPKQEPAEVFKKLDTNSDGKVSAEEWNASAKAKKDPAKAAATFAQRDKDGDKSLTLEEFSGGKK